MNKPRLSQDVIHTYIEEYRAAKYDLERWADFQEWLTDVYLNDGTTLSDLWKEFEDWEDHKEASTQP